MTKPQLSRAARGRKPKYVIQVYKFHDIYDDAFISRWYGIFSTRAGTKEVARFYKLSWAKEFIKRHA